MNMKTVDIVVPVYNEEEGLTEFYKVITQTASELKKYRFTFIFVNDGSSDNSLSIIKYLARDDQRVKYISFSRNFGKEAAIYAGLQHTTADMTILMDADLQHPPALIPEMIQSVDSGEWDACGAKRKSGFMSRLFNNVNNKMSTVKLQSGATDYMCMNRKFVNAVMSLSERQRFTKGLFAWVGFRVKWIDYIQNPRTMGTTKWSFRKLLSYAMDGLSSFSTIPLKLVTWSGAIICVLAVLYIVITLLKTLIKGIDVPGYATTLVVVLFLGGVVLLSLGVVGDYIGRIFLEIKNRPVYLMDSTNIKNNNKTPRLIENNVKIPKKQNKPVQQAENIGNHDNKPSENTGFDEKQVLPEGQNAERQQSSNRKHYKYHNRRKKNPNQDINQINTTKPGQVNGKTSDKTNDN